MLVSTVFLKTYTDKLLIKVSNTPNLVSNGAVINIHTKGKQLVLNTWNKKRPVSSNKDKGIGLSNTGRRLKLLYPTTHSLSIKDDGDLYEVELIVELEYVNYD